MNIFTSDKAPFVVVLLLSLLGWHIAQLTEAIQSTRAVSYAVATSGREIKVRISNVSRTHAVRDATFVITCPTEQNCLAAGSGRVSVIPPTLVQNLLTQNDANAVIANLTLAAGGATDLIARFDPSQPPPLFFFSPNNPEVEIYIYDANSITGFFVTNFTTIVAVSFLFFLALLAVILLEPLLAGGYSALSRRGRKRVRK